MSKLSSETSFEHQGQQQHCRVSFIDFSFSIFYKLEVRFFTPYKHCNLTAILLCGTITEPGLPVVILPIEVSKRGTLLGFCFPFHSAIPGEFSKTTSSQTCRLWGNIFD